MTRQRRHGSVPCAHDSIRGRSAAAPPLFVADTAVNQLTVASVSPRGVAAEMHK